MRLAFFFSLFGTSLSFRTYWRSAFLFERLLNPHCDSARSVLHGEDEWCKHRCSAYCFAGFDIQKWRSCLMGLTNLCYIVPEVFFSASVSAPDSVCITEEGELYLSSLFHCPDCREKERQYTLRVELDEAMEERCLAAEYEVAVEQPNIKCVEFETKRTDAVEWFKLEHKELVNYENGNRHLSIYGHRPVHTQALLFRSTVPECLMFKSSERVPRYYGILERDSAVIGFSTPGTVSIPLNKREEDYMLSSENAEQEF